LLKAENPILVTLFGIEMDGSEEQPENAPYPILVTLLPIEIETRELQPEKA
jgi:hypothetical protein